LDAAVTWAAIQTEHRYLLYIGGLICEHIQYYCDNPIFPIGFDRFTIQDKIKYAPAPLGLFVWR
jgi:hypothetical protein